MRSIDIRMLDPLHYINKKHYLSKEVYNQYENEARRSSSHTQTRQSKEFVENWKHLKGILVEYRDHYLIEGTKKEFLVDNAIKLQAEKKTIENTPPSTEKTSKVATKSNAPIVLIQPGTSKDIEDWDLSSGDITRIPILKSLNVPKESLDNLQSKRSSSLDNINKQAETSPKDRTGLGKITSRISSLIKTRPIDNLNSKIRTENYPYPKNVTRRSLDFAGTKGSIEEIKMSGRQSSSLDRQMELLNLDNDENNFKRDWEINIKLTELVMKPTVFDGVNPSPAVWWEEYMGCMTANAWKEATVIKYFPASLKGAAKDWYLIYLQQDIIERKLRLNGLAKRFRDNFIGDAHLRELDNQFEKTKQELNESVSTFIPRVRRILRMMDPDITENEEVRQICRKLRRCYLMDLARFDVSSIAKLHHVCLRVEAGLIDLKTREAPDNRSRESYINKYSNNAYVYDDTPSSRIESHTRRRPTYREYRRQEYFSKQYQYTRPGRGRKQHYPLRHGSYIQNRYRPQDALMTPRSSHNTNTKGPGTNRNTICRRCNRNNHSENSCFATTRLDGSRIDRPQPSISNSVKSSGQVNMVDSSQPNGLRVVTKTIQNINMKTYSHDLITTIVKCNDHTLEAIVDTGSQATLIDKTIAIENNWLPTQQSGTMTDAQGCQINCLGSFIGNIELIIGKVSKSLELPIAVVESLPAKFLLGMDALAAMEICIHILKRTLAFEKDSIQPGIRTLKEVVIPPRHELIIKSQAKHVGTILTIPVERRSELLIGNSISEVVNNETETLVCNISNKEIILKAGTQIGTYEPIHAPVIVNTVTKKEPVEVTYHLGDNLNEEQRTEILTLIKRYKNIFANYSGIGKTHTTSHTIELLPGSKPFQDQLRRRPQADVEECDRQVKDLLNKGYIEESNSPWAAAYVLAKKKNGTKRLCIDFRKLNESTKKIAYPLPNIEDCLETLAGKKYFSQLDMASGFWQIPMSEESKELTAFRTESGLYHFNRMPFGLTNAPASFQRMANAVYGGLKGINLQVFIDDICIASETWIDHLSTLEKVFDATMKAGLTLQGEKCSFGSRSINFLGHLISEKGIQQDPAKLEALLRLKQPSNKDDVRQFLGMCGYYRKFVPRFAIIAEPLTKLTRKNIPFEWNIEQKEAFQDLLTKLAENATLSHFNHHDSLMLKTDASRKGIAGILLQMQQGEWKIITCISRRLNTSETNYGITDLEGLAVVYSVQRLRNYLLGKHFEIIVDHCALCVLNKRTPHSARLIRWQLILSEFDFTIKYTKGSLHEDVDCLSRNPIEENIDEFIEHKVYNIFSPNDSKEWINSFTEEELEDLKKSHESDPRNYQIKENIWYYKNKLIIPKSKRNELLEKVHNSTEGGHGGTRVTINKLRDFHWTNMKRDTEEHIKSCSDCQMIKIPRSKPPGNMEHHESFEPLELVSLDSWNTNKASRKGNKHVLVAIDNFTRFVMAKAYSEMNGTNCAYFITEFIGILGAPKSVLSDNAQCFLSVIFKDTLGNHNIEQRVSTPGHSQSNAVAERAIQTIQDRLASTISSTETENDWDDILPIVVLSINTSFHSTTRYSPYESMFGRNYSPNFTNIEKKTTPRDLYAQVTKKYLESISKHAIQNITNAQNSQIERYEKNRPKISFEIGDRVISRNVGKRDDTKLGKKYIGPFQVENKKKDIYELKHLDSGKKYQRHVSSLKLLVSNIMLLSLLSLITKTLNGVHFDKHPPILYRTTNHVVEKQQIVVDFALGIKPPCSRISMKAFGALPASKGFYETIPCDDVGCFEPEIPKDKRDPVRVSYHQHNRYKDILSWARHLDINPGDWRYDPQLVLDVEQFYQDCMRKFTEILQLIDNYENTLSRSSLNRNINITRKKRQITNISKMAQNIVIATKQLPTEDEMDTNTEIQKKQTHNQYLKPFIKEPYINTTHDITKTKSNSENKFKVISITLPNSKITIDTKLVKYIASRSKITVEEITRLWTKYYQTNLTKREKRGVVGDIIKDVAKSAVKEGVSAFLGGMGANIVTDLVKYVIDYINPNSTPNRLKALLTKYDKVISTVQLHQEILDKLIDQAQDEAERRSYGDLKNAEYSRNINLLNVIRGEINLALERTRTAFTQLIEAKLKGHVSMPAIAQLTNINEFRNYETDIAALIEDKVLPETEINPLTLMMTFQIHDVSEDTYIIHITGVSHWDFNTDPAQYKEYRGSETAVFNLNTHCIKALPINTMDKVVRAQCLKQDFIDPATQLWSTIRSAIDPRKETDIAPIVEYTPESNYIICYPHWIVVDGTNTTCDPDLIKLPADIPFEVPEHPAWRPIRKEIKTRINSDLILDYVHKNAFREKKSNNTIIDQLIEMRLKSKEQLEELKHSVVIERDIFSYIGITVVTAIISAAVCYIIIIIWKMRSKLAGIQIITPRVNQNNREGNELERLREEFLRRNLEPVQQRDTLPRAIAMANLNRQDRNSIDDF